MSDPTENLARIALIAIHGVADQQPRDTARAAADMLLRAARVADEIPKRQVFDPRTGELSSPDDRTPGRYQGFEQRELRIGVTPLRTDMEGWRDKNERTAAGLPRQEVVRSAFSFRSQPQTIATQLRAMETKPPHENDDPGSVATAVEPQPAPSSDDISWQYMHEQLSAGVIPESETIYETVRLDSIRTGSRSLVHVYEMYWADLSRPVGSIIRWLIEFYQLLFHLCLLGRKSLDFARVQYEPQARLEKSSWAWLWPFFSGTQIVAEQLLALAIPILNLYLLGLASAVLPLLLPDRSLALSVTAIIAVTVVLLVGFAAFIKRQLVAPSGRPWPSLLLPLLLLGAGVAWICFQFWIRPENTRLWAVAVWWVVPVIAITWLMASYQKARRGALPLGLIAAVLITGLLGYELAQSAPKPAQLEAPLMEALLRTAERTVNALSICWILLFIFALLTTIIGWLITKAVPDQPTLRETLQARDKTRRAAWTTNLTIVVPAITVLILNLTLWQALITSFVPNKPAPVGEQTKWNFVAKNQIWQIEHKPILEDWGQTSFDAHKEGPPYAWEVTRGLMARSYTPLYFAMAALFCLAALILVWSILPAVIAEIRPAARMSRPDATEKKSSWLGESLSSGFRAMRVSGEIIRFTFLLMIPAVFAIYSFIVPSHERFAKDLRPLNEAFLYVGVAIVLGIVASRGPFKPLALGLRAGLDVALDVINWLRLHPLAANPRARICARYHALLQQIEAWRDFTDETQGYDAIVILAHSQGTVITADLLRYLKARSLNPSLPIYLFTMGCPLRQLYSLRFPHLYAWSRHADTNWAGSEPHPESIAVRYWVNAYRSGDYVGRHLWHPDQGQNMWSTSIVHEDGPKREFCIGAGAHTHYWDETAPEIAVELDRIVGLAARNWQPPP
ncbi:MAG: hypothetical protein WAO00_19470 [Chthoniobacterales bacterium]